MDLSAPVGLFDSAVQGASSSVMATAPSLLVAAQNQEILPFLGGTLAVAVIVFYIIIIAGPDKKSQ